MQIILTEYSHSSHEFVCKNLETDEISLIDPFVTNALSWTDEDYANKKGETLVGGIYNLNEKCAKTLGCFLPEKNELTFIEMRK